MFSFFLFIKVSHVTVTYRDGRVAQMENVYVRGSKVRFIILPDMLRNAPMFKSKMTMGGAAGRGKSGMIRSSGISEYQFF
jgi:small nuclear ribonucleoprotein D3